MFNHYDSAVAEAAPTCVQFSSQVVLKAQPLRPAQVVLHGTYVVTLKPANSTTESLHALHLKETDNHLNIGMKKFKADLGGVRGEVVQACAARATQVSGKSDSDWLHRSFSRSHFDASLVDASLIPCTPLCTHRTNAGLLEDQMDFVRTRCPPSYLY